MTHIYDKDFTIYKTCVSPNIDQFLLNANISGRCTLQRVGSSLHCKLHTIEAKQVHLSYKKYSEKVVYTKQQIDSIQSDITTSDATTSEKYKYLYLKLYGQLLKEYEGRIKYMKCFFAVECYNLIDKGHRGAVTYIREQIEKCEHILSNIYLKESKNITIKTTIHTNLYKNLYIKYNKDANLTNNKIKTVTTKSAVKYTSKKNVNHKIKQLHITSKKLTQITDEMKDRFKQHVTEKDKLYKLILHVLAQNDIEKTENDIEYIYAIFNMVFNIVIYESTLHVVTTQKISPQAKLKIYKLNKVCCTCCNISIYNTLKTVNDMKSFYYWILTNPKHVAKAKEMYIIHEDQIYNSVSIYINETNAYIANYNANNKCNITYENWYKRLSDNKKEHIHSMIGGMKCIYCTLGIKQKPSTYFVY